VTFNLEIWPSLAHHHLKTPCFLVLDKHPHVTFSPLVRACSPDVVHALVHVDRSVIAQQEIRSEQTEMSIFFTLNFPSIACRPEELKSLECTCDFAPDAALISPDVQRKEVKHTNSRSKRDVDLVNTNGAMTLHASKRWVSMNDF